MKIITILFALLFSANSYSDTVYGDWVVTTAGESVIAKTVNSKNEAVGVFCGPDGEACFPYMLLNNKCAENSFSRLLLNSDGGVYSVTTVCALIENAYVNLFSKDDNRNVLNVFIGGQPFGFALALESGMFKSARFSGIGAKKSLEKALKLRNERIQNKQNSDLF